MEGFMPETRTAEKQEQDTSTDVEVKIENTDKDVDKYPQTTKVIDKIKKNEEEGDWTPKDFKRIYAKNKKNEEELETQKEITTKQNEQIKNLLEHNEKISSSIEKMADTQTQATNRQIQLTEDKAADEEKGKVKEQLADFRKQKLQAMEDADYAKVDSLDEDIFQLRMKERQEIKKPAVEYKPPVTTVDNAYVDDINKFLKERPFFDNITPNNNSFDPALFGALDQTELRLQADPKWKNRPIGDRLLEAERLVNERFGNNGSKKKVIKPSPVESKTVSEGAGGTDTITLTKAQCEQADKMGITRERYGRQLAFQHGLIPDPNIKR